MKNRDSGKQSQARRTFLAAGLLGLAAGIPAVAKAAENAKAKSSRGKSAKLTGLNPLDAPAADVGYTPAILAEGQRLLFISGQGPRDYNADMEAIPPDFRAHSDNSRTSRRFDAQPRDFARLFRSL